MKRIFALLLSVLLFVFGLTGSFYLSKSREPVLANKNADDKTKAVFSYLINNEGESVLSAQQESTWMGRADYETDYIFDSSGKHPVIKGFDYMNDDFDGVNERAIKWWNKGGLVTVCWHCGSDFSGEWKDCIESEVADWKLMLTEGTDEYKAMISGMDKAAAALKELEDKGVTVLWRPFHEFDGNWFWWSKGGSESFKKLWKIMYNRYTEHWELNNLIWVLGFSDQGKNSRMWYPGDDYCDIIGADTYSEDIFSELYRKMTRITMASKPLCLHECGTNPTERELEESPWIWFMTWHTEYLTERNPSDELNKLYNSDIVITLDEFVL